MHRRRQPNAFVLISLVAQIFEQLNQLPVKPPLTCALVAANVFAFLFPVQIGPFQLWDIDQNCIHPALILSPFLQKRYFFELQKRQYFEFAHRLVLSGFIHVDEMHLYYNMLSFLVKGVQLEQSMGSLAFGALVVYALLASHSLLVALAYLSYTFDIFPALSGYNSCAVGFSAVIFCLKFVLYMRSSGVVSIYGFAINVRYAAWAELVLISILNPNASFVGHLAGILAGVLYCSSAWGLAALRSRRAVFLSPPFPLPFSLPSPLPSPLQLIKYAAWSELLLLTLLHPHASVLEHVAGVVAGVLLFSCGGALLSGRAAAFQGVSRRAAHSAPAPNPRPALVESAREETNDRSDAEEESERPPERENPSVDELRQRRLRRYT